MKLSESSTYTLTVGQSEENGRKCYLLTNKETEVVEVETNILLQAYQYLDDLTAGLQDVVSETPPTVEDTVGNLSGGVH